MNNLIHAVQAVPDREDEQVLLTPLDFSARPSTIICLVGPDHAIPAAYLHMLGAIEPPGQGRLEILGKPSDQLDQQGWKYVRTHTGFVAGNTPLLSVQTGLANVMLPALYHRIASAEEVEHKAQKLLTRLGCRFDVDVLPSFMSNLERCLVTLARALILDPQVLFLEYPFQELDTEERKSMALVLGELKEDTNLCIIAAVNNLPFVKKHADEIIYTSDTKAIHYSDWDAFVNATEAEVHHYVEDEGATSSLTR